VHFGALAADAFADSDVDLEVDVVANCDVDSAFVGAFVVDCVVVEWVIVVQSLVLV
jgi:hypothetical protein